MSKSKDKPILNACKPIAQVIYINAELQRVGHTPFQTDCEGRPHGSTSGKKKKYLTKRETSNFASGGSAVDLADNKKIWTVLSGTKEKRVTSEYDPFTGLLQRTGDTEHNITPPTANNCTTDSITARTITSSQTVAGGCGDSETTRRYGINFSNENTDEKLSQNASKMLGHFDVFDTTNIPEYNTFVDVVPGTDGKKERSGANVENMPSGLPWRAMHLVGPGGITKSKLIVKFYEDTAYTVAEGSYDKDGEVDDDYDPLADGSLRTASSGSTITIDPPSEKNTFIEVHACQFLTNCLHPLCSSSLVDTEAKEERKKARGSDEYENCAYPYGARFMAPNGDLYQSKSESSSTEISGNADVSYSSSSTSTIDSCELNSGTYSQSNSASGSTSGSYSYSSSSKIYSCPEQGDSEFDSDYEESSDNPTGDVFDGSYSETMSYCDCELNPVDQRPPKWNCSEASSSDSGPLTEWGSLSWQAGGVSTSIENDCSYDVSVSAGASVGSQPSFRIFDMAGEGTGTKSLSYSENSVTLNSGGTASGSAGPPEEYSYSGSISASATVSTTRTISLGDKVDTEGNYTESVTLDDPDRDGTVSESISYNGSYRSHIKLISAEFEVETTPKIKKRAEHRTYINYLLSELDNEDPNKAILSHKTFNQLMVTRDNDPEKDDDSWTVKRKFPISIALSDADGSICTISSVSCFTAMDVDVA